MTSPKVPRKTTDWTVYDFFMIVKKLAQIEDLDEVMKSFKVDVSDYDSLKHKTVYLMFNVKHPKTLGEKLQKMSEETEKVNAQEEKRKRDAEISLRQEN